MNGVENIQRLQTIPGVGDKTALAFAAYVGDGKRFNNGNEVANYVGLRAGTLITHLNAKRVSEYSIEGIKTLIAGSSQLKVTYIDGNGKEKTVKIKPEKIL